MAGAGIRPRVAHPGCRRLSRRVRLAVGRRLHVRSRNLGSRDLPAAVAARGARLLRGRPADDPRHHALPARTIMTRRPTAHRLRPGGIETTEGAGRVLRARLLYVTAGALLGMLFVKSEVLS